MMAIMKELIVSNQEAHLCIEGYNRRHLGAKYLDNALLTSIFLKFMGHCQYGGFVPLSVIIYTDQK